MLWPLSDDTNVILLLSAWLGGERQHTPLTLQEYNLLASWLHRQSYRPRNLADVSCTEKAAQETGLSHERLSALLDRRITLGFYLEEWQRRGFWVLGRGDPVYPDRVRKLLRSQAPPVLFGTGKIQLLDQGGLAVVGPDQITQTSAEQTKELTELCAQKECAIVVAGKETTAMSAINAGGSVTALLQGKKFGSPMDKFFRQAHAAGKFAALSSRSPVDNRSFSQEAEVGHLLMAICDSAVYVDGTELGVDRYCLASAMQEFQGQKKCFVWTDNSATAPAQQLLQIGIQPWNTETANRNDAFTPSRNINQYASLQSDDSHTGAKITEQKTTTTEADSPTPDAEDTAWEIGIQLELFPSRMDWDDFLSKDAAAILLLCIPLETGAGYVPLSLKEFYQVKEVLQQRQWTFGTLRDEERMLQVSADTKIKHGRMHQLLAPSRDIKLGANLNKWEQLHHAWVLTQSDPNYPKTDRSEMPPLIFGVGNQSILRTDKLAIIGPDALPRRSVRKALEMAKEAVGQGQTIIAAGHLKVARKIVDTVLANNGCAIWILYDATLEKQFATPYRQAIRHNRLLIITSQIPSYPAPCGEEAMTGRLAVELTDALLYIDGANSKTRKDRFEIKESVLRHLNICKFFHGRFVSPEGQELLDRGIRLWTEEEPHQETEEKHISSPPALLW